MDNILHSLGYKESKCIYKSEFYDEDVEYSLVMPVYNQQEIILTNVKSAIFNTTGIFEFIIIVDNCEDNTEYLLINFFTENENKNITIIKNDIPLFETTCDNIGAKIAKGKYIVEIQADMKVITYGYNFILSKPCRYLSNVIAVSGRLCNKLLEDNYGNWTVKGKDITKPLMINDFKDYNTFHIYESCIRGPLLIDSEKLKKLDYFDEENFFQNYSDHDLMARAFYNYGWICGYTPIEFYAPPHHGSGRKFHISSEKNKQYWNIRQSIENKKNGFYFKIGNDVNYIPIEYRQIILPPY